MVADVYLMHIRRRVHLNASLCTERKRNNNIPKLQFRRKEIMSFHRRCGSRIHLSNLNRTARRNINDFNHGIVLSAEPMVDDVWFQVRIDEKVGVVTKQYAL